MQPGTQDHVLSVQPSENTIAPKITLSTPDYISLLALICLPMLLLTGIVGKKIYRKHRARQLKQQVMKLERAWRTSYQTKQDS